MESDIGRYEDYAQATLSLASRACGFKRMQLLIPPLSEVAYQEGTGDKTRITTIVKNILSGNPQANHVLYLCQGKFSACAETLKLSDADWAHTIQQISRLTPRGTREEEIVNFFRGFEPFLSKLEPPCRAFFEGRDLGKGVASTRELLHFVGYDTLESSLLPKQDGKSIDWTRNWERLIHPEKDVENVAHGVRVTLGKEDLFFNHKFLHSYFTYVLDDSYGESYSIDQVISAYGLIRLVEFAQFVKDYPTIQRVPLIVNSAANSGDSEREVRDFRRLYDAIYNINRIGDCWTTSFIRAPSGPYASMDPGREIVNTFMEILNYRETHKAPPVPVRKILYGVRPSHER